MDTQKTGSRLNLLRLAPGITFLVALVAWGSGVFGFQPSSCGLLTTESAWGQQLDIPVTDQRSLEQSRDLACHAPGKATEVH